MGRNGVCAICYTGVRRRVSRDLESLACGRHALLLFTFWHDIGGNGCFRTVSCNDFVSWASVIYVQKRLSGPELLRPRGGMLHCPCAFCPQATASSSTNREWDTALIHKYIQTYIHTYHTIHACMHDAGDAVGSHGSGACHRSVHSNSEAICNSGSPFSTS